jgi:hypothetical protein
MRRKMAREAPATAVPKAVQVQLGRLFGSTSVEAVTQTRTVAEWKRTLRKILQELESYVIANIDTDELHANFIASGLFAAKESLKEDNFWPAASGKLDFLIDEARTAVREETLRDWPKPKD